MPQPSGFVYYADFGFYNKNSLLHGGSMALKLSNLKKAYRYWKKNGAKAAFYASLERYASEKNTCYIKKDLTENELLAQRNTVFRRKYLFSILVPAYETQPAHFREMIDSVLAQTYPYFELLIADAGSSDKLAVQMQYYKDDRLHYFKVGENRGISENTNAALERAKGDYIALLDHDDTLAPDALYRMMERIAAQETGTGRLPQMLYSDEDKADGDMQVFYEPHFKGKFNLDLLLSNNYICHFLVMKASLIKELGFRREYDGAQDHDLVLRAAEQLFGKEELICHIPYVLYHWRCHQNSTADNPESKRYAYEAGRRAVEDFCKRQGWRVMVAHTQHLGFFRVNYQGDVLKQRADLAAVGGRLLIKGKVAGGAYAEDGSILYAGLHKYFSGYMHRALMQQDVYAADVRKLRVREDLKGLLVRIQTEEADERAASLRFGEEVQKMGLRILFDPYME